MVLLRIILMTFTTILFLIAIVGCKYKNKDPITGKEFEEIHMFTLSDGCKVSKVLREGISTIYRIKCSDGSGAVAHSCGRNCNVNYTV